MAQLIFCIFLRPLFCDVKYEYFDLNRFISAYCLSQTFSRPDYTFVHSQNFNRLLYINATSFTRCIAHSKLTVSHLAMSRSCSKAANSRRSWRTVNNFQTSSRIKPISTIPAINPSTIARIGTGGGQSGD